jgi:hypothetical protein
VLISAARGWNLDGLLQTIDRELSRLREERPAPA